MRADLALVGFGNVGRRFARLLQEQDGQLASEHGLDCRIVAVSTRSRGAVFAADGLDGVAAAELIESSGSLATEHHPMSVTPVPNSLDCIHRLAALSDAPLKVVVETTTLSIQDGRPAIDHVEAALKAGCHAVTANKGPAAFDYRRLASLAAMSGVSFLFEGAVMDGIPVFNFARETLPAVRVLGFRGVINSTTNEILTALEDGNDFGPALARMQAAGIAEADPSLDIDGWDAAAKAAALANVLLDGDVTPHEVERSGIRADTAARARAAITRGMRLRMVASGKRGERPRVDLVELPQGDLLGGLRGTANALVLDTDLLGQIAVCQLGGSLTQTAYALLSDLVTIRRRQQAHPGAPARRIP
jgi:homoserine dehydrogenase